MEELNGNFKAAYLGAEYHNIDGTGWPDAVVMENQGSVFDGTYRTKMYFPECTCMVDDVCLSSYSETDWGKCNSCYSVFPYQGDIVACPKCGARVVN